ncbi:MAG TPA: [protein ADP-ribosylglutamate] hydrolase [Archaeoglobus profundus]|nr:[protein ADP-ribosylglutamate] hydrolase [Archaeoglobus profundus]
MIFKELKLNGLTFKIAKGDITKYPAEAIVNAANKYLEHGGGVALAIAKAATEGNPEKYTQLSKEEMLKQIGRDYIEHGEVVVTPSLALEKYGIKYVIHTVGPICNGLWNDDLKEKLKKALIAPLKKADELGLKSIAFPAISAGIYGCPLEEVVKTFVEVIKEFAGITKNIREVSLVLYDEESVKRALKVLD